MDAKAIFIYSFIYLLCTPRRCTQNLIKKGRREKTCAEKENEEKRACKNNSNKKLNKNMSHLV